MREDGGVRTLFRLLSIPAGFALSIAVAYLFKDTDAPAVIVLGALIVAFWGPVALAFAGAD